MRRPLVLLARSALGVAALALGFSCAGGPAPKPAEPAVAAAQAAPAKVRKERTVIVKTPVLLKETVLYPDGLVDSYTVYTYDAARLKLLSKAVFDPARVDPVEKTVFEYGADGNVAAENVFGSDGAQKTRHEVVWNTGKDKAGQIVTERDLDAKNQVQFSSAYEYDKDGRRLSWKTYDSKGGLKATTSYGYDATGRLALIELKNSAGTVTMSIKVEYSGDGASEKRSYFAPDGSLQKIELSTLVNGRLTRFETRRADGSLAEAVDYQLGPLGERIGSVTTDGSGKVKEKRGAEYYVREDQKIEVYYE
jgi:YD repeat-containing protein